jgi:hypothetical protein
VQILWYVTTVFLYCYCLSLTCKGKSFFYINLLFSSTKSLHLRKGLPSYFPIPFQHLYEIKCMCLNYIIFVKHHRSWMHLLLQLRTKMNCEVIWVCDIKVTTTPMRKACVLGNYSNVQVDFFFFLMQEEKNIPIVWDKKCQSHMILQWTLNSLIFCEWSIIQAVHYRSLGMMISIRKQWKQV